MGRRTLRSRRRRRPAEVRYATIDTNVGMLLSNVVMYFIILGTGVTLFPGVDVDAPFEATTTTACTVGSVG